jgi:tRNA-2-methylthio-N6-dimethylallyladenosine synthase
VARKTYFVETIGCQMNFHDGERAAGLLEADGYAAADDVAAADVIVLNTCSVRERAEEKLFTRLGELREATAARHLRPTIAVMGCVAQQEGEALRRRDAAIDVIVGTQSVKQLPALVGASAGRRRPVIDIDPHADVSFPLGVVRHSDPVRAWVTIIEGCNEYCAFCVVPYTRGHERMRPVRDIVAEVEAAAASGRREVQLLGQIVNHYQAPDDASCDFAALLARVSEVRGIDRIRFASPHPRHVTPRLLAALRDLPKVCKHLHLPVQSGSNAVLTRMRRRYTRETYLDLVAQARATVPGLAISTDMIVGFPGESERDFDDTLDLVARARYHSMYSFKYSPRPNTLAIKRMPDDVPEAEKTRRILALQARQKAIQAELFDAAVGSVEAVLVDGPSRRRAAEMAGRTSGNTVVNFPGPASWLGSLRRIRITEATPNSLRGVPVSEDSAKGPHAD